MKSFLQNLFGFLVIWAVVLAIYSSINPLDPPQAIASLVLAIGATIQRLNTLQRYLGSSSQKRKESVHGLAQEALLRTVRNRPITDELLTLVIHVWEVPLWYRRLFNYKLRRRLKDLVRHKGFRWCANYSLRPTLVRAAAAGLVRRPPSGVSFRKGVGLVGVCLDHNDSAEVLTLDVAEARYQAALKSPFRWAREEVTVTRGLEYEEANKLAPSYAQVMARIVKDSTGEPLGCVTISVQGNTRRELQILEREQFMRELRSLADSVAPILASLE